MSHTNQHIALKQIYCWYQLLPQWLEVKPLVPMAQGHRIAQSASFQYLAAHVQHCYCKQKSVETDLGSANWTIRVELRSLKHLKGLSLTPRQELSSRQRND